MAEMIGERLACFRLSMLDHRPSGIVLFWLIAAGLVLDVAWVNVIALQALPVSADHRPTITVPHDLG